MLPSASGQTVAEFPSPGISPAVMTATAAVQDEDNFVDLYKGALAVTPPPSANVKSSDLQWNTTLSFAGNAEDNAAPVSSSNEYGESRGIQDTLSPPLDSTIPPSIRHATAEPRFPASSRNCPAGSGVGITGTGAEEAPLLPMTTMRPPAADSAPFRPAKPFGSSKTRAKGGARQPRRAKSNAATTATRPLDADLDDGAPDNTVCLLAVGKRKQRIASEGITNDMGSATSLEDVIDMLTVGINRNGREAEMERVETGERAVLRVRALARSELRYGIVVLEVEGSRAAAVATARELKAASPSTPIIAVAPPHAILTAAQLLSSEGWRDFNEILSFPVGAAKVRGLITRYLLAPPGVAAAAASSGMAGEPIGPGSPNVAATFGQLGQHTAGSGSGCSGTLMPSFPVAGEGREAPHQQQKQPGDEGAESGVGGLSYGAAWNVPPAAEEGVLLPSRPLFNEPCPCARKALEGFSKPGASMLSPSSSPSSATEALAALKKRVFGGSEEDRALPCALFGEDFDRKNAEAEDREYDFVFRHGTILLRVEEGDGGEVVPTVFSLCEYATDHFGDLTGLPLQWLFHEDATNKKTAAKILLHIERSDSDSMCCYINLKSKVRRWTSSFVSIRSLIKRPERVPGQEACHERLPAWFVLLKVCLPSALGLIKEPELLQQLYSKKASEASKRAAPQKGRSKAGSKRSIKKTKTTQIASDGHKEGDSEEASGYPIQSP